MECTRDRESEQSVWLDMYLYGMMREPRDMDISDGESKWICIIVVVRHKVTCDSERTMG